MPQIQYIEIEHTPNLLWKTTRQQIMRNIKKNHRPIVVNFRLNLTSIYSSEIARIPGGNPILLVKPDSRKLEQIPSPMTLLTPIILDINIRLPAYEIHSNISRLLEKRR